MSLDASAALTTVLDLIRTGERATGTKEGCAEGDCGACTVVLARLSAAGAVAYAPVNACILLGGQLDGAELLTIEDLAGTAGLHPVQKAMVAHHGAQCGFCTPGIVMSLFALDRSSSAPPSRDEVTAALTGNLCRCTGYRPIVDAALSSCGAGHQAGPCVDSEALQSLDDGADVFCGTETTFFAAPASERTLAALLDNHPDAWVLAGGTDLGLSITKGLRAPTKVIHVGRVPDLTTVAREGDVLVIGAAVTLARAYAALDAIDPDLGDLMARFGSPQVRASGTVGGNLANGSPIGDLAPCFIALGASVELASVSGPRVIPLEDFFLSYKTQDRRPGEYVRTLRVPNPEAAWHYRVFKVTKRFDEDITAVLGAFAFAVDGSRVVAARIGCGGMAAIPARARATEAALAGTELTDRTTWTTALDAIETEFSPLSDHRASADYRRRVLRNLLLKALLELAGGDPRTTRLRPRREVTHG